MRRPPPARALRPRRPSHRLRSRRSRTARPAPSLLLTEAPRAILDLAATAALAPLLAAGRRGDGHPVLVLPGALGDDLSTAGLRGYLRWLGYAVSGWEIGTNVGPTERVVSGARARLAQLAESTGQRVSLVGWSLGGLYAYELARRAPGSVRQVVTLGSPAGLAPRSGTAASSLYDRVAHLHLVPGLVPRPWSETGALRVPATAVYTRADGVVPWRSCLLPPATRRQNVEVRGSHYGLAHNPAVLHLLADRLGQPAGRWRPFRAAPPLRGAYP